MLATQTEGGERMKADGSAEIECTSCVFAPFSRVRMR